MPILDNEALYDEIRKLQQETMPFAEEDMVVRPFEDDFAMRFCWSSNSLEGNTLSLDETVSLIEYDEVGSGHSYSEYREAKQLHRAIRELLIPMKKRPITESWIKRGNARIMDSDGSYRTGPVYIGTLAEAVYYPPSHEKVPELMAEYVSEMDVMETDITDRIRAAAKMHMDFERIHPFRDGNGRVGRMILNQQLINSSLLPVAIEKKSDYRQAFRRYDRNGDISLMEHIICKAQIDALERLKSLGLLWMENFKES